MVDSVFSLSRGFSSSLLFLKTKQGRNFQVSGGFIMAPVDYFR